MQVTEHNKLQQVFDSLTPDEAVHYVIRAINREIAQEIRIDALIVARHRHSGFRVDGFQVHRPHQTGHPFMIHRIALCLEPSCHLPNTVERRPCILLIQ